MKEVKKLFTGKRKFLWIIFIVAIGGFLFIQNRNSSNDIEELQTITVQKGNIVSSITLSGQVRLSNTLSVFSKASGIVSEVYVADGQNVKAGDKLAEITLDSEGINNQASAWASYLSAKKNVEMTQASQYSQQAQMLGKWDEFIRKTEEDNFKDVNSTFRDLPEFHIAEKEWLAAEATYKTSATSISSAQASLSSAWYNYQLYQSTIVAPVDGTIVGLNVTKGLSLSGSQNSSGGAVSQIVGSIKTTGNPVASFTATEIDINKLQVGQKATLTLDSISGKTFEGTISAVDRVGSVTNGVTQYGVLITFSEPSEEILTNMALTAEIVLERKENVISIPVGAVIKRGEVKTVRVVQDGEITPIRVETGLETDTEIEIMSGLEEGDIVVMTPAVSRGGTSSVQRPEGAFPGMGGGMVRIRR